MHNYSVAELFYLDHNANFSGNPTSSDEPAATPHEGITLTAVTPIHGPDANKPPDYNDALKYRKAMDEGYPEPSLVDDGYPEPSLVDQPPSYDSVN